MVKSIPITGGTAHAVQNLRGWCIQGTVVLRLRKDGLVTGDPVAIVDQNAPYFLGVDAIDTSGGCYVEVVSGTLTEGYLFYN